LLLYIDGVQAGSNTGSTGLLTDSSFINFGRIQAGNNYFAGSIDEVAAYNVVLSSSDVAAHYNAGK
jgi:hypothetical protein